MPISLDVNYRRALWEPDAAAYLAEFLAGAPVEDRLDAAAAAGAFAVAAAGDWEGLPDRAELAATGAADVTR
ncbi:hypothetical protein [Gandjariella thermophila]|uniref:Carbohydrate kinase PfkB domain-containing protein n=1 Tax=Gandjariella thermophila TaxID=1931992 RepID=A0A4D4JCL0_9PSEU|nr:hypothetical protein [Gandjariella thermophila]GDY33354.1 hypothetical protein GTS_49870 [Gandjariella thermophila]